MCFEGNTNHALSLQMICILTYLNLLLDTVLQFSLLPLITYLDVNKHSNIVEHINWVLSELSVGSAQNPESHWSDVHITLKVEHFSFHALYKKCGLQRDLMSCSSWLTLQRRSFSCTFPFLKKLQIFLMLPGIMHAAPPLPKSPPISSYQQQ